MNQHTGTLQEDSATAAATAILQELKKQLRSHLNKGDELTSAIASPMLNAALEALNALEKKTVRKFPLHRDAISCVSETIFNMTKADGKKGQS